jgi:D-alanyl-lipoteichoic acid acyltransferase DltB (MBOAT superfamily)
VVSSHALLYVVVTLVVWLALWRLKSAGSRRALMLLTSYLLYASWGLAFLGLLVLSSLVNYGLGAALSRRPSAARLWGAVILNLALLGAFKYVPTAAEGTIVLPAGISFWTFQALSYLFDVYQGTESKPTLTEWLLYMAFWPTVLSGPICRLPTLLPQFRDWPTPSRDDVHRGLDRICLGLWMGALGQVLASGLPPGSGVDAAFDTLSRPWTGLDVWVAAIGYGFVLFFNFAGYSHLVIGAARLFGIRVAENFDRPYLATTPSEFWTRWHMSLSSWIRDYVFLPLVMVRRETWWRSVALVVSMIAFGLWHKGSILFAAWGGYQGVLLVLHRAVQQLRRRVAPAWPEAAVRPLSWLVTFGLICLGWILFRASDVSQALAMWRAVLAPGAYGNRALPSSLDVLVLLCVLGYFGTVGTIAWYRRRAVLHLSLGVRAVLYGVAVYAGVLHPAATQAFIYFQF